MNIENAQQRSDELEEFYEEIGVRNIQEYHGLNDDLAKVRINSKWTIIDREFRIISRKDYDNIGRIINNMIIAQKDGGYVFINLNGEEICPPYDNAWAFSKGLALVQNNGKMFFIDKEGTRRGPVFDYIGRYGNYQKTTIQGSAKEFFEDGTEMQPYRGWIGDHAIIFVGNKLGVINRRGKTIVEPVYDEIAIDGIKQSNYIPVSKKGKWGYVDKRTGEEVTDIVYDPICQYTRLTSHTKLSIDGKYGLIDKRGRQLCPFIYDQISSFIDGIAIVRMGLKFGYLRKADCTLIDEVRFESAYPFINGYGEVTIRGVFGKRRRYIDKEGKLYKKPPKRR